MVPLYWRDAANEYIEALHTTLWGRAYDVNDPKGREQALDALEKVVEGIEERRLDIIQRIGEAQPKYPIQGSILRRGNTYYSKGATVTFNDTRVDL